MRPTMLARPALLLCALAGLLLVALCAAGLAQALPGGPDSWAQPVRFDVPRAPERALVLAVPAALAALLPAVPALLGLLAGPEAVVRRRLDRLDQGVALLGALVLAPGVAGGALLLALRPLGQAALPATQFLLALPFVLWSGTLFLRDGLPPGAAVALASLGLSPTACFRHLVLPLLARGLLYGVATGALVAGLQAAVPGPWSVPAFLALALAAPAVIGGVRLAGACLAGLKVS